MIRRLLPALFSLTFLSVFAQVPTEQDCLGAIPVCQYVFVQENAYSGEGNYPFELPVSSNCTHGSCLVRGEQNDVWYSISALSDGLLGFTITPLEDIDYDWAVYRLNDYACSDLLEHIKEMQVSCNYAKAFSSFITGPNGASELNCQDMNGTPFNDMIPVLKGETYVINVSRYSKDFTGYTIDFSISTATLFNDEGPQLGTVDTTLLSCGTSSLTFNFTGKVICDSIFAEDFTLEGPGGPFTINDIYGEGCLLGNEFDNRFTMEFEPYLTENGEYFIKILPDHPLYDACDKSSDSMSLTFSMNLVGPDAEAGTGQYIDEGTKTILHGIASNGKPPYEYAWYPESMIDGPSNIIDPTTVILDSSQQYQFIVTDSLMCRSDTASVTVFIIDKLMAFPSAFPPEVCSGESVMLVANALGGAGQYSYEWTSGEPGWLAAGDSIFVNPLETTYYSLKVEDSTGIFIIDVKALVNPLPIVDLIPKEIIEQGNDTIRVCVDDFIVMDAGHLDNPDEMLYVWSNQTDQRHYVAKSNGNLVENQSYWVEVKNQLTGCSNTDTLTIVFDFGECAIGIEELDFGNSSFLMYPNPTSGSLSLSSRQAISELNIDIVDLQGKKIHSEFVNYVTVGQVIDIDLGNLKKGIYLLHLLSDKGYSAHKIVKK